MTTRSIVIFAALSLAALWREAPATPARAVKPVDRTAELAALVVDPFAEVGCRGTGSSTTNCARPECDCSLPTGLDPCFEPESCACYCLGNPEGLYTPPR